MPSARSSSACTPRSRQPIRARPRTTQSWSVFEASKRPLFIEQQPSILSGIKHQQHEPKCSFFTGTEGHAALLLQTKDVTASSEHREWMLEPKSRCSINLDALRALRAALKAKGRRWGSRRDCNLICMPILYWLPANDSTMPAILAALARSRPTVPSRHPYFCSQVCKVERGSQDCRCSCKGEKAERRCRQNRGAFRSLGRPA